jgi:hypothetical protein
VRVVAGGDSLNVRATPSASGETVGSLADGTVVTVVDGTCPASEESRDGCSVAAEEGDGDRPASWWIHVETTDGLRGWVSASFLAWAD